MGDLEHLYNSLFRIRFLDGSIPQDINGLIWGLLIVLKPCSSHSSKVCRLGRITSDILIEGLIGAGKISGDARGEKIATESIYFNIINKFT